MVPKATKRNWGVEKVSPKAINKKQTRNVQKRAALGRLPDDGGETTNLFADQGAERADLGSLLGAKNS